MGAGRGRATAVRHFARHSAAFCSAALLVFLLVAGLQYAHGHGKFGCETGKQLTGGAAPLAGGVRLAAGPVQPTARGRTLVIYVYGPTDPDYEENFRFFLREAVRVSNLCRFGWCGAQVSSGVAAHGGPMGVHSASACAASLATIGRLASTLHCLPALQCRRMTDAPT